VIVHVEIRKTGVALLFVLLQFVVDLGTIIASATTLLTIKPHERLGFSPVKKSSTQPQSTQTQQAPAPQAVPVKEEKNAEEKILHVIAFFLTVFFNIFVKYRY
jgi:hypothetical protein